MSAFEPRAFTGIPFQHSNTPGCRPAHLKPSGKKGNMSSERKNIGFKVKFEPPHPLGESVISKVRFAKVVLVSLKTKMWTTTLLSNQGFNLKLMKVSKTTTSSLRWPKWGQLHYLVIKTRWPKIGTLRCLMKIDRIRWPKWGRLHYLT